jgi:hypothetical protein
MFHLGGWEIIYEFLNHILGEQQKYSGVSMHLGHYRSHVESQIQMRSPASGGFFSPKSWRLFIQSGVAARLMGMPSTLREPCCELRYLGCDGTGIGVCISHVQDVTPVWVPPAGVRPPTTNWGRLARCAIGDFIDASAKEKDAARKYLRGCTEASNSSDDLRTLRDNVVNMLTSLPTQLAKVLEIWFTLDSADDRWDPVRRILRACSCQDSLLGIVPVSLLADIDGIVGLMTESDPFASGEQISSLDKHLHKLQVAGMGPEIAAAVTASKSEYFKNKSSGRVFLIALASLLSYIGNSMNYLKKLFQFHSQQNTPNVYLYDLPLCH